MDNPAKFKDLTDRGYAGATQVGQTRLDAAWRALQREPALRGLVAWIEAGSVSAPDVVDVVADAAMRVLRNPSGAESESSAIDDYTEDTKLADSTMDMYFTAAEIRRLQPVATVGANAGSFAYTGYGMGYDC